MFSKPRGRSDSSVFFSSSNDFSFFEDFSDFPFSYYVFEDIFTLDKP